MNPLDNVKEQSGPNMLCAKCGANLGQTNQDTIYKALCEKCSPFGFKLITTRNKS